MCALIHTTMDHFFRPKVVFSHCVMLVDGLMVEVKNLSGNTPQGAYKEIQRHKHHKALESRASLSVFSPQVFLSIIIIYRFFV